MKPPRMWLVLWVVGLVLSCGTPGAVSSGGARYASEEEHRTLEMSRPPGPPRGPPVRTPSAPGRVNRRRNRNPFEPREPVFNAEPTPEQREAARRRRNNVVDEAQLREIYWRRKAEAEQKYPEKRGKYEEHHHWPIYLGGLPNGKTYRVPADYHQLITNAFRSRHAYGQPPPEPAEAMKIMLRVYSEYPIPQLIGIPNP